MSTVSSFRIGAVSAGICCMLASVALSQQAQPGQRSNQRNTSAQSEKSASQSGAGQSDRATSAQSGQAGAQQGGPRQAGQAYTANFRGDQSANAGGKQSQAIDQFFAACLLADNQAEVEMSQLAQQQAENEQVKQFAEKMVQDHQKMIQQLQQVAGAQGGAATELGNSSTSGASSNQSNAAPGSAGSETPGQTSLPGSSGASQTTARAGEAGGSTVPSTADATNSLAGAGKSSSSGAAIAQLAAMDRQIVQRKSQMAKDDLQQKSGAEFDKCYVGNAINAHVHALAALEVLSQSHGQVAQLAQQSAPVVKQHLDHAKGLMKELEGQSERGRDTDQAERSTSRPQR